MDEKSPSPEPGSQPPSSKGFMFAPSGSRETRKEGVVPPPPVADPGQPEQPRQLSIKDLQRNASPPEPEEAHGYPPPPPPQATTQGYPPPPTPQPIAAPQSQFPQQAPPPQGYGAPPAQSIYTPDGDFADAPPPENNLPLIAVGAAVGVALAGVVALALEIVVTGGMLHLFVTLGVAAGIGYLANHLGGRGQLMGIVAAGCALLAIVGGKFVGVAISLPLMSTADSGLVELFMDRETYAADMEQAAAYYNVENDGDLRAFMWNYGYSMEENEYDITDAELAEFRNSVDASRLLAVAEANPDYETWKQMSAEYLMEETLTEMSVVGYTRAFFFTIFDIIFLFIDVGIAFYLASRLEGDV